mgnify:FL=1
MKKANKGLMLITGLLLAVTVALVPLCPLFASALSDTPEKLVGDINKIGSVHLGKYDEIEKLYERYGKFVGTAEENAVTNSDILLKAKTNVEWLKSNGYYYFDDFSSDGIHSGNLNFECLNSDIEQQAEKQFNLYSSDGSLINSQNMCKLSADEKKDATVYINSEKLRFNPTKGYSVNGDWNINDNNIAVAIHGIKSDAYDNKPIYKAQFTYDVSTHQANALPIIVTEFTDADNWKGFSFTNGVSAISKTTSVDSDSGEKTVKYGTNVSLKTQNGADGNFVASYSRDAQVTMEYKLKDDVITDSDYYLFTIKNISTDDDSAPHGTYTEAYIRVKVSEPLTNLYFGTRYASGDASIDNVIIFDSDLDGMQKLDEKIGKLSTVVEKKNADEINDIYNSFSAYKSSGFGFIFKNADKIEIMKAVLDYLIVKDKDSFDIEEITTQVKLIDALPISLGTEDALNSVKSKCAEYEEMGVISAVKNYSLLKSKLAKLSELKQTGYFYTDDFDNSQLGLNNWELKNTRVNEEIENHPFTKLYKDKLQSEIYKTPIEDSIDTEGKSGKGLKINRTDTYKFYEPLWAFGLRPSNTSDSYCWEPFDNWQDAKDFADKYNNGNDIFGTSYPQRIVGLKESVLGGNSGILSAEFDINLPNHNSALSSLIIPVYDDEDHWEAIAVGQSTQVENIQKTVKDGKIVYSTDRISSVLYDENGNAATEYIKGYSWVNVKMEYVQSQSGAAKYVFTITGKCSDDKEHTYTLDYPVEKMADNLYIASRFTYTDFDKATVDNVKIKMADSSYVEGLISGLPELSKLTNDDYKSVMAVNDAYNRLSDAEKSKVTSSAVLAQAVARVKQIKSDYFENVEKGGRISFEFDDSEKGLFTAENASSDDEWGITNNPNPSGLNGSAKVLGITRNCSDGDNSAVYLINRADGKNGLATLNAKVLVKSWFNYDGLVYDYVDKDNWSAIAFAPSYVSGSETVGIQIIRLDKRSGSAVTRYWVSQDVIPLDDTDFDSSYTSQDKWIDVSVVYGLTSCTVYVNTDGKIGRPMNVTYPLIDTNKTKAGLVNWTGGTTYFDDISVTYSEDSAGMVANTFRSNNSYILNMRASQLADIDSEKLNAAVNAYNNLSDAEKNGLVFVKDRLDILQNRMSEITASGKSIASLVNKGNSTAVFTDDFEDETSLWRYVDTDPKGVTVVDNTAAYGYAPKIVYSSELKSNALSLKGSTIVIKDALLCEKTDPVKISFKSLLADSQASTQRWSAWRIYYGYKDSENWQAVDLYWDGVYEGGKISTFWTAMSNSNYSLDFGESVDMDPTKPIEFNMSIDSSNKMIFEMLQDNKASYQVAKNHNSTLFIAFTSTSSSRAILFDDINIEMKVGDWDEDTKNNEIKVNYTGNTFVHPNESVSISGENLGTQVTDVYIMQLNNIAGNINTRSYVDYTDFSFSGVKSGTYFQDAVAHNWGDAYRKQGTEIKKPDIVQKTEDSVKFVIPDDFTDGVYAVLLYDITTGNSKEIYINTPHIDYTVGNDGKSASAGGTLRVIGNNIAVNVENEDKKNDSKRKLTELKAYLVNSDKSVAAELSAVSVQSDYSVKLSVPFGVKNGEYELWIHSGYGDDTCWAIPTKVVIADDIRSTWNKKTINIKEAPYNAVGTQVQNVTGIVTNALQELAEAGGGTLYFPRGIYRFVQPIVLPENVTIAGESMYDTQFVYSSYKWQVGELPRYLIGCHKNNEIRDISFYGHRVGGFIYSYGEDAENLYVTNIRTHFQPHAGAASNAPYDTSTTLTFVELSQLIEGESVGHLLAAPDQDTDNVQIKNCELLTYGKHRGIVTSPYEVPRSSYWQIDGLKMNAGWSCTIFSKSLVENSRFYDDCCLGLWGNGVYTDNCSFEDQTQNNRELMVADMGPTVTGGSLKRVNGESTPSYTLKYNGDIKNINGAQIYVVRGQGEGQTRIITSVERIDSDTVKLTIDNPFLVEINRNSRITIRNTRQSQYYVDCNLYNGSCFGFYGGFSDTVYDGLTVQRVGDMYQWAMGDDPCWYFTQLNTNVIYDPYHFGSQGTEVSSTFSKYILQAYGYRDARSFTYRNNDWNGYVFAVRGDGFESIYDLIAENNSMSKCDVGINFYGYGAAYKGNGILLRGNHFDEVKQEYSDTAIDYTKITNSVGYKRLIIADFNDDNIPTVLLGDVNGDGKINLKDSTYIRLYVVGDVTLTEKQLQRADVNKDGVVDLKDSTMIKYFVLGLISSFE